MFGVGEQVTMIVLRVVAQLLSARNYLAQFSLESTLFPYSRTDGLLAWCAFRRSVVGRGVARTGGVAACCSNECTGRAAPACRGNVRRPCSRRASSRP